MNSAEDSQQPPKKASYDPGWNDPPTFSYNSQVTPGNKPRISLNKRVAFPMNGSPSNAQNTSTNPSLPPMPMNIPPIPSSVGIPAISNTIPLIPSPAYSNILNPMDVPCSNFEIQNPKEAECSDFENQPLACELNLEEILDILNSVLNDSPELGNKLVDIRKRIDVMHNMWKEGKLPLDVQIKTYQLTKAMESRDMKLADAIHKEVMVNHTATVGAWMVAIKQLVMHVTIKEELLLMDKQS